MAQWPMRPARLRHASLRDCTPPRNVITSGSPWIAASASKSSGRQPRRISRSVSSWGSMTELYCGASRLASAVALSSVQPDRNGIRTGLEDDLRGIEAWWCQMHPVGCCVIGKAIACGGNTQPVEIELAVPVDVLKHLHRIGARRHGIEGH